MRKIRKQIAMLLSFFMCLALLLACNSKKEIFNVTFDFNYVNAPESVTIQVEKGKTVPEPTAPTRSGYNFEGWYTEKETTEENKYDFSKAVTKDFTLYAGWTQNEQEPSYSIIGTVYRMDVYPDNSAKIIEIDSGKIDLEIKRISISIPTKKLSFYVGKYGEDDFKAYSAEISEGVLVLEYKEDTLTLSDESVLSMIFPDELFTLSGNDLYLTIYESGVLAVLYDAGNYGFIPCGSGTWEFDEDNDIFSVIIDGTSQTAGINSKGELFAQINVALGGGYTRTGTVTVPKKVWVPILLGEAVSIFSFEGTNYMAEVYIDDNKSLKIFEYVASGGLNEVESGTWDYAIDTGLFTINIDDSLFSIEVTDDYRLCFEYEGEELYSQQNWEWLLIEEYVEPVAADVVAEFIGVSDGTNKSHFTLTLYEDFSARVIGLFGNDKDIVVNRAAGSWKYFGGTINNYKISLTDTKGNEVELTAEYNSETGYFITSYSIDEIVGDVELKYSPVLRTFKGITTGGQYGDLVLTLSLYGNGDAIMIGMSGSAQTHKAVGTYSYDDETNVYFIELKDSISGNVTFNGTTIYDESKDAYSFEYDLGSNGKASMISMPAELVVEFMGSLVSAQLFSDGSVKLTGPEGHSSSGTWSFEEGVYNFVFIDDSNGKVRECSSTMSSDENSITYKVYYPITEEHIFEMIYVISVVAEFTGEFYDATFTAKLFDNGETTLTCTGSFASHSSTGTWQYDEENDVYSFYFIDQDGNVRENETTFEDDTYTFIYEVMSSVSITMTYTPLVD